MNLQTRKLSLIEWVASLDDKDTIDRIENLKKGKILKPEIKPMSLKEYYKMIQQSEDDIQSGRVYAHEAVVKYMRRKR